MPELANSTLSFVCQQHALPEGSLMQANSCRLLRVLSAKCQVRRMRKNRVVPLIPQDLIQGDDELTILLLLANDPHRVEGEEEVRCDPQEIHQRLPMEHGVPESLIVVSHWIGPLPLVATISVGTIFIRIRPIFGTGRIRGPNAHRVLKSGYDTDASHMLQ